MSEALQIWLFVGAFGLIGASFAWQWAHRYDCETKRLQNMQDITRLRDDVKYLLKEVGEEHNEGLRHRTHFLHNRVILLAQKLGMDADGG